MLKDERANIVRAQMCVAAVVLIVSVFVLFPPVIFKRLFFQGIVNYCATYFDQNITFCSNVVQNGVWTAIEEFYMMCYYETGQNLMMFHHQIEEILMMLYQQVEEILNITAKQLQNYLY